MKRNKFSQAQIVKILAEFENGKNVDDLCREHNVGSVCLQVNGTKTPKC
jgi:hypothetical protein